MKIKITEEHIKNGKRHEADKCPLALAILDATGEQCYVSTLVISLAATNIQCYTPNNVYEWIKSYDDKESVQPCEFDIKLEKLGLKEKQNENQSN